MTVIAVPKILRDKLTDQGTDALIQIIDKVEDRSQKIVLEMAEERFEKRVAHVETKIAESKADLESKIAESKADLEIKIAKVETKVAESKADLEIKIRESETRLESRFNGLDLRMAQFEARITRWMFVFWIGQFASTVGALSAILFAFFKR